MICISSLIVLKKKSRLEINAPDDDQQAPQIRLIPKYESNIGRKIQSSITTTIPLWKNQIAIAMTLLFVKRMQLQRNIQVPETTNQLIQKNSGNVENFNDWNRSEEMNEVLPI